MQLQKYFQEEEESIHFVSNLMKWKEEKFFSKKKLTRETLDKPFATNKLIRKLFNVSTSKEPGKDRLITRGIQGASKSVARFSAVL